jgi:hypothetical protein
MEEEEIDPVPSLSFQSVDSSDTLDNNGESFADDSNLGNTSSLPIKPHQVAPVNQMLHSKSALGNLHLLAQSWERALFTTGGAINFQKSQKSFWFIFHWHWKNGVASLVPPPENLQLKLTEGSNLESPVVVPQKSTHDTYRTLGVYLSPSGLTSAAEEILLEKAEDYQIKIATLKLPREAAWLSYNVYLLPKVGYPLPAMSLSEDACYSIQAPTLMAVLPKLHLNRHIAWSIVFGPVRYGGLAIKTLYSIQSIGQLTLFTGHLQERDKTSNLLNISISQMQLIVGTCTSILQLPFNVYGVWLDSYWLSSFWQFLQRSQLSITLAKQWLPDQARDGDVSLMEHFVNQGFKASQLLQLNRCRVYLQVLTLAAIVSADGLCIIPDILVGAPLLDQKSTLNWPNQQRPPTKD